LTSASSSSLSALNWPGEKFNRCWGSSAGAADAIALPAIEKVSPANPSAGTAALVIRFVFEACFARCMAASSMVGRTIFYNHRTPSNQSGQDSREHEM